MIMLRLNSEEGERSDRICVVSAVVRKVDPSSSCRPCPLTRSFVMAGLAYVLARGGQKEPYHLC